ncbi:hypothetical protein [Sulfitobacter mediterraneus]|uniref:hypothetical protein n=1 Tax=Sulfitobacter mediterraneus TaxID=83219 RepID=UPI0021A29BA9|nr:hypothetical protein [Sulfitobacter mediterraneus]UWR10112.1 hypothetical protein K3753_12605 [Sulfitobacter mediterraneus]
MIVLYVLLGAVALAGIGIAIYEWRSKRTLLKHDLNKARQADPHTESLREHITGVIRTDTHHR